jgi:hypothetical protein
MQMLYVLMMENPTQNFCINYICCFSVGASACKPSAEPTFEQATYVKNIRHTSMPTSLKADLVLYHHSET